MTNVCERFGGLAPRHVQCLNIRNGQNAEVAGVILVRRRPGSAKDGLSVTIEDETGVANDIVWTDRFAMYRGPVSRAR
jgi:error-prone DNA polymerase